MFRADAPDGRRSTRTAGRPVGGDMDRTADRRPACSGIAGCARIRHPRGVGWPSPENTATQGGLRMVEALPRCHGCGAAIGEQHDRVCDVPRCRATGLQWDSCDHKSPSPVPHEPDVWTGRWPGEEDCERLGWFARLEPGRGWVPCDRDAVPAENHVLAGQAACSYSCRTPPRRSRRWMRSWVSWSCSVIGSGSGASGRALAMP